MNTTIKRVSLNEKDTLANLLEKYNYEFSQYDKRDLPKNARYGYKYLDNYFTDNDRYAYFIHCDSKLAGFALIRQNPKCERLVDWSVAEFFVIYNYRRQGVATEAVRQLFDIHKGYYHINYHMKNIASELFWNKIANIYSDNNYDLVVGNDTFIDGTESSNLFFEVK